MHRTREPRKKLADLSTRTTKMTADKAIFGLTIYHQRLAQRNPFLWVEALPVGNLARHRNAKRFTIKPFASSSHKMLGYGLTAANLLVITDAVPWFKYGPWHSCLLCHVHALLHCHDTVIEP